MKYSKIKIGKLGFKVKKIEVIPAFFPYRHLF